MLYTFRSAIAENFTLYVSFTALSSIEPELLPIEVLHYAYSDFRLICSCNLDLNLISFIYELERIPTLFQDDVPVIDK